MKQQTVPYKRVIFVCANKREDGRPACGLRGSEALCKQLKDEVKKRGLKGKVRAMKSGCMDFCEIGPNVMVFEPGQPNPLFLNGVTQEDLPGLIETYLK